MRTRIPTVRDEGQSGHLLPCYRLLATDYLLQTTYYFYYLHDPTLLGEERQSGDLLPRPTKLRPVSADTPRREHIV